MVVPSLVGDIKIVSLISMLVLNTLTLKLSAFCHYYYYFSSAYNLHHTNASKHWHYGDIHQILQNTLFPLVNRNVELKNWPTTHTIDTTSRKKDRVYRPFKGGLVKTRSD